MKTLLLIASALLLSTGAVAKVTYEDAVNSTKEYYQANAAVHNPPQDSGLGPEEEQEALAGGNEMGKWKSVGSGSSTSSTFNRVPIGASYSDRNRIAGSECIVGAKGYYESGGGNSKSYALYDCQ